MVMYISEALIVDNKKSNKKQMIICTFVLFFISRIIMNDYFKKNIEKLFIINEQMVVNSLYENTVEKYGIDDIKNKTIYITTDYYRALKPEELTHFLTNMIESSMINK